jgi:hypothetical protein
VNHHRAESIGYLIGFMIPLLGALGIGLFFGFKLGAKREPRRFVWWPFAIAIGLVVLTLIRSYANSGSQIASDSIATSVRVEIHESLAPSKAVLLRLDAEKEAALKSRLVNSARDQLTKVNESTAGIKTEVSYFLEKPQKMMTAVVSTDEGIIEAHIITLKGGKQFEIMCIPNEPQRKTFRILTGQCGEKIKATLGDNYATQLGQS